MGQENATIRQIDWLEVFPWLHIFRSFRVALDPKKIVLAAVAVFLTWGGWRVIGWAFDQVESVKQLRVQQQLAEWPFRVGTTIGWADLPSAIDEFRASTWGVLGAPFLDLFGPNVTVAQFAFLFLIGLWGLAVWSLFGGMIARMAALELATEETVSVGESFHHARGKYLDYLGGPLFPLLGVALLALPMILGGLFLRSHASTLIASLVWFCFLLDGLVMAILLVGLLFGWPLMWATVAVEGGDTFESLSRAYGYVFQRPLRYIAYTAAALLAGGISWLIVLQFASLLVYFGFWGASWGGGNDSVRDLLATTPPMVQRFAERFGPFLSSDPQREVVPMTGAGYAGAMVITFWVAFVQLAVVGYGFSYFWTAATAVYFVLRYDIDGAELDEVQRDDDDERTLPPLAAARPAAAATPASLPIVERPASAPPASEAPKADTSPANTSPPASSNGGDSAPANTGDSASPAPTP